MNKKIENYITYNYYTLKGIAEKITKNIDLSQDLLHEVILQLYDKDEIILKSYDDNSIRYYITAVMRTNYFSKTSPFYYRIRRERMLYVDITECNDLEADQQEFENQTIFDILEESYTELNWFEKSLLEMYLTLGSIKKVSESTNIPITSAARYINNAKQNIKDDINKKYYE